jgi:hypothetical protein
MIPAKHRAGVNPLVISTNPQGARRPPAEMEERVSIVTATVGETIGEKEKPEVGMSFQPSNTPITFLIRFVAIFVVFLIGFALVGPAMSAGWQAIVLSAVCGGVGFSLSRVVEKALRL